MLKKGSLVKRVSNVELGHIDGRVLAEEYPPEGSICVVVTSPKERNLASQLKRSVIFRGFGIVGLKKAVDVMSENRLYENCEVSAFERVK